MKVNHGLLTRIFTHCVYGYLLRNLEDTHICEQLHKKNVRDGGWAGRVPSEAIIFNLILGSGACVLGGVSLGCNYVGMTE